MKKYFASGLAASFMAASCALAADVPPVDAAAEGIVQNVCRSGRPLAVIDSFYLLPAKHGSGERISAPALDFNGDIAAAPDGAHGDIVAAVAGLSGKCVIPYEMGDISYESIAESFRKLADDIESGAFEAPSGVIASLIMGRELGSINSMLPPEQRLTLESIADHKKRALSAIIRDVNDPEEPFNVLSAAFKKFEKMGIPVFVAAGNTGPEQHINILALYPNVYAVGALNPDGSRTAYTNGSSLVRLWRSGRFSFRALAGGTDINNDGRPEFLRKEPFPGLSAAEKYNGRPVAGSVSEVQRELRDLPGGPHKKIRLMNIYAKEGVYPTDDLMKGYGYPEKSGAALQMKREAPFMHHPSLQPFREDADGKLVMDPDGTGDTRQRILWDATSYAAPNICARR